jgi:branched-chain amino acid aminotransferase
MLEGKAMFFEDTHWVWLDGRMVVWEEAQVHASAHGLHYGTGVFEGTRAYATDRGPAIFRLDDHLDRLFASARVYGMKIPYTRDQLAAATREVIERNIFGNCYIRHLCYMDEGSLGIRAQNPIGFSIIAWPWENQHGAEGLKRGVRATISPWQKFSSTMMPTTAKAAGQYLNSRLAVTEAASRGFDEAILLDVNGNIAEASVANVFIVRDGRLYTNDERSSILMGITRRTIIQLACERRRLVEVRALKVEDLMSADEVFLTGTASEIVPVREVDGQIIGSGARGPVTTELQTAYFNATRGLDPRHEDWLNFVGVESEALAV